LFGGSETAQERVADKARQVVGIKVADLAKPWPYAAEKFDLVQSCFAMEALENWDAFHRALAEAHLVLRPGGVLIMANTAHGNDWTCEGQHIRTLFVTADDLRWQLADAGFALKVLREIQSSDVSWRDQGYSRVLLTQAVKA
jgi:ubiquinone/menaquinone biosynthesis C-methylase UbiE